jgi:glutamate synthase (NADPH/NADH) small chain
MPNMSLNKVKMPEQDPDVRSQNFREVALGYDEKMAVEEAQRCLQCKNAPCMAGCPVGVRIPEFIDQIRQGDYRKAYEVIKKTNSLPAVCGRVCPQENQCEARCVRGKKGEPVGIGRLERFCADYAMAQSSEVRRPQSNGIKVAVIGAGPAGLSCAGALAQKGYEVTIFEAFHKPGGVLVYGIPEFRLPKKIVEQEIDTLRAMGVTIKTDYVIGKIKSIDEILEEGFRAVFISTGAGLPTFMNIEGENLNGVYSANE